MGQQQLLLIVLGILIVGLAIFIGISLFRANAIESKRNNVLNECFNLASLAQQYYLKPSSMGGGGKSFEGWRVPPSLSITANGHYEANITSDHVEIIGTGNEVVTGTDSVKVQTNVFADSIGTIILQ